MRPHDHLKSQPLFRHIWESFVVTRTHEARQLVEAQRKNRI